MEIVNKRRLFISTETLTIKWSSQLLEFHILIFWHVRLLRYILCSRLTEYSSHRTTCSNESQHYTSVVLTLQCQWTLQHRAKRFYFNKKRNRNNTTICINTSCLQFISMIAQAMNCRRRHRQNETVRDESRECAFRFFYWFQFQHWMFASKL